MIQTWAMTDVGLVRRDNQDAYGIDVNPSTQQAICVVCDGMGGMQGGALASRIAVDTFLARVKGALLPEMQPEEIQALSAAAAADANAAIREAVEENTAYRGMGTTLVAAVSYREGVVVTNVGDSRAYHITAAGIRRISKDHSLVETLVDRGDITAEEARTHPKRNYITRALGPEPVALCDGYIVPMARGDFILLCTDGLVSTVTDQEMHAEISRGENRERCLNRLLEISKRNGAADNVTAVLLQKQ